MSDHSGTHSDSPLQQRKEEFMSPKIIASNKRLAQRQVIYPHIEKAMDFVNDQFWKDKLMMTARGKLPNGFSHRNGCIYHKKIKFSLCASTDPATFVRLFIEFMQSRGIYSDLDTICQQHRIDLTTHDIVIPSTWSQVPKNTRVSYIDRYIQKTTTQYNLSPAQKSSLRKVVFLGVKFKIFNSDTIILNGASIDYIFGIVQDDDTELFSIDPTMWTAACYKLHAKLEGSLTNNLRLHPMHISDTIDYKALNRAIKDNHDKVRQSCSKLSHKSLHGNILEYDNFILIDD